MVCFIYGFCAGVCATLNCGRIIFFKANKDYANNNVLIIMRLACQFCTNYEKLIKWVHFSDFGATSSPAVWWIWPALGSVLLGVMIIAFILLGISRSVVVKYKSGIPH